MAEPTHTASGLFGDTDIDLRYYASLLLSGRNVIATIVAVSVALGWLVGMLQTPQYRAGAMLQIEPPTPTFMSVSDALVGGGGYWQNTDFYNTQFRILRSRSLGEKVVQKLEQLHASDRPPGKETADAAAALMSTVTVEPITDTRLAMVWVTHEDPRKAAVWANTVAEVYIDESLAKRVDSARRALDWLQERLAVTQQAMKDAQGKLFKSYQSQDLFVPEGSVSAVTTSITKLNDDYIAAQARRIVIEAALKQVEEMRRLDQSLDTVPQVATDASVLALNAQVSALNLEITRLKEKFKQAHPEVLKVQAQLDQIRRAKDARAAQVVDAMQAEYSQLQKREAELRSAIDAQKAQAATQSRKAGELEAIKKEADSAKNLYEILLQKLNETDIAASVRSSTSSVVERATAPTSPVFPNKKRLALLALLVGLAAGVALVLGRDYLDNTLKGPEEVERFLHLDLLAAVPRFDDENAHLVTEAYQNLRTALIFGRKDETGQVVLVTGTAPQEGKTTTLLNLGKLLASAGEKTVLLDFDLRRAQLHSRLGLTREPGLIDFFVNHEPLETLVRPSRQPNLSILTAGPLPPNPPAILARKTMADLLGQLRREFDWILMDSPPLASVTDALLLARHADMVVMVIEHNKVDKRLVKRTVGALRKASSNLLGAVLNAVDIRSQGYYYYYYQHDKKPGAGTDRHSGPRAAAGGA